MLQYIDRVYTYDSVGVKYTPATDAASIVIDALYHYLDDVVDARVAASKDDTARKRADHIVDALSRARQLFASLTINAALHKTVFPRGAEGYTWYHGHEPLNLTKDIFAALKVDSQPAATAPAPADVTDAIQVKDVTDVERRLLVRTFVAALSSFGIVKWREDYWTRSETKELTIPVLDFPLLVGKSALKAHKLPPAPPQPVSATRTVAFRVPYGDVVKYWTDTMLGLSSAMSHAETLAAYCGRVVDVTLLMLLGRDTGVIATPFEPFKSAANFVRASSSGLDVNVYEADNIGKYMPEIVELLQTAPRVMRRAPTDVVAMNTITRVAAE
jgi:hypothetical protein